MGATRRIELEDALSIVVLHMPNMTMRDIEGFSPTTLQYIQIAHEGLGKLIAYLEATGGFESD